MKLLILGSGFVGKALIERGLIRGHEITAFTRDPRKVTAQHPSVRVVQGDVLDPGSLDRAVVGHDAVFFVVGPGQEKGSTVRTDGMRNVVQAMGKAGVKRLIAISGLGAGVTRKNMGFLFDQVLARTTLKGRLQDQNGMEAEVRKSKLDWVVVRPGELLDIEPSMRWILSWDGTEIARSVSRADVVNFMLDQVEGDEYVRKPVAIGRPDAPVR